MESSKQNPNTSPNPSGTNLLSLAFDCTEMVTQLSRGYRLERQGDHQKALSVLGTVEDKIDSWLDQLDDMEAEGVDKKVLLQDLKEAKEAVSLDSWE